MPDTTPATDQDAILEAWCTALRERLDLEGVEVDIDAVLGLAGKVAHAVIRPAAPLTAFVVGYAAALATQRDGVTDAEAFASAASAARELASTGAFGPAE